ncbi:hypothetical protein VPHK225_0046 [Vibrio phage K225]
MSEYQTLINLHRDAGFRLPPIMELPNLRASYNFKAKKAGIPTHTWSK